MFSTKLHTTRLYDFCSTPWLMALPDMISNLTEYSGILWLDMSLGAQWRGTPQQSCCASFQTVYPWMVERLSLHRTPPQKSHPPATGVPNCPPHLDIPWKHAGTSAPQRRVPRELSLVYLSSVLIWKCHANDIDVNNVRFPTRLPRVAFTGINFRTGTH